MDKEQSYFVEDFSNTFQSIGLQFQQSLDELAKQFSGKKLSEQIGNTISTFFNKDGKFNFASEPNIEQKDLNKNNIDDLINNKSFDMMRKIIKDNIFDFFERVSQRSIPETVRTVGKETFITAQKLKNSIPAREYNKTAYI